MSAGNWQPTGWRTPVTQVLSGGKVVHHHHDGAYAAIVLDGRYVERGDAGLMIAEAGDLVVHLPFDHHGNDIDRGGARICNLSLTPDHAWRLRSGRLRDRSGIIDRLRSGAPLTDVLAVTAPCRAAPMHEADPCSLVDSDEAADLSKGAELLFVLVPTLRRYFSASYGAASKLPHRSAIRAGGTTGSNRAIIID